jgi:hypothetical protein
LSIAWSLSCTADAAQWGRGWRLAARGIAAAVGAPAGRRGASRSPSEEKAETPRKIV